MISIDDPISWRLTRGEKEEEKEEKEKEKEREKKEEKEESTSLYRAFKSRVRITVIYGEETIC